MRAPSRRKRCATLPEPTVNLSDRSGWVRALLAHSLPCRLPLAHSFGRRMSLNSDLAPLLAGNDQYDDHLPLDRSRGRVDAAAAAGARSGRAGRAGGAIA